MNEWMSVEDAATYLGVTTKSIRRRIADGSLPAYRMGPRLIRVKRADLDGLCHRIPTADLSTLLDDEDDGEPA